jgi:hypothetical protein
LDCPEGQAAAVTGWPVVSRLAGDLQPISKFHTKYCRLMRRHAITQTSEGIEETLKHGLEYLLHGCGATVRQDGAADENARATGSEVDRCTLDHSSD